MIQLIHLVPNFRLKELLQELDNDAHFNENWSSTQVVWSEQKPVGRQIGQLKIRVTKQSTSERVGGAARKCPQR